MKCPSVRWDCIWSEVSQWDGTGTGVKSLSEMSLWLSKVSGRQHCGWVKCQLDSTVAEWILSERALWLSEVSQLDSTVTGVKSQWDSTVADWSLSQCGLQLERSISEMLYNWSEVAVRCHCKWSEVAVRCHCEWSEVTVKYHCEWSEVPVRCHYNWSEVAVRCHCEWSDFCILHIL